MCLDVPRPQHPVNCKPPALERLAKSLAGPAHCTCVCMPAPTCCTMSADDQIRQAFAEVASSSSGQQRAAAAAAAALASDPAVLPAAFWECTSHICLLKKRTPGFKRCAQLIQHMATAASAAQLNLYLSQCISAHNAKDRHVRLRICEICASILSGLPLDAEIQYVPLHRAADSNANPGSRLLLVDGQALAHPHARYSTHVFPAGMRCGSSYARLCAIGPWTSLWGFGLLLLKPWPGCKIQQILTAQQWRLSLQAWKATTLRM